MVRIAGSHPAGPGSIPGAGTNLLLCQYTGSLKSRQHNLSISFTYESEMLVFAIAAPTHSKDNLYRPLIRPPLL